MVTPEDVKHIAEGLACDRLEVDPATAATSTHVIVSAAFEGKRLVQRHQVVYAVLGDRMREEIHALSMKTLTPVRVVGG
jgi:acid stress-induced BolA-like protein IbaG/YrbA